MIVLVEEVGAWIPGCDEKNRAGVVGIGPPHIQRMHITRRQMKIDEDDCGFKK